MTPNSDPRRHQTAAKLLEILQTLLNLEQPPELSEGSVMMKELDIDSVGMVDLVEAVEEAFSISFPDDLDLKKVRTFGDVIDQVLERVGDGSP